MENCSEPEPVRGWGIEFTASNGEKSLWKLFRADQQAAKDVCPRRSPEYRVVAVELRKVPEVEGE